MIPTMEELLSMKDSDIRQAVREQLVDLNEIHIDKKQPVDARIRNYLEQVHNPFLVKSGEYVVKFQYTDCEKDMNDCMYEYISKMSKIRC